MKISNIQNIIKIKKPYTIINNILDIQQLQISQNWKTCVCMGL